ncbi:uncharacterized protein BP5553_02692 [Venustampulla echinocandica]|uniref:Secreted protein n=1 Tax=Venustampulla echinocandica TaxID=2656787 RepID=A0A370TS38_9HELO|nr:uncharacterized protein BP5553_02692 [Venustampulla echinocandica]RDL38352.1 hypothetical protein BP5553_02692 [Venustampulla echinocandica]
MQLTTIVLSLFGFFIVARAADSDLNLPYPLVPFQYNGILGGHNVQLNGTIQDIYAQMKELHPDFELEHAIQSRAEASNLTTHDIANTFDYYCCPVPGHKWQWALGPHILDGIKYLKGIDICDVGASSCVRIGCSWNSAIYLCNDNRFKITPMCNYIASYAKDLIDKCSEYPPVHTFLTCGQEFDTDGYNVIVREDRC